MVEETAVQIGQFYPVVSDVIEETNRSSMGDDDAPRHSMHHLDELGTSTASIRDGRTLPMFCPVYFLA